MDATTVAINALIEIGMVDITEHVFADAHGDPPSIVGAPIPSLHGPGQWGPEVVKAFVLGHQAIGHDCHEYHHPEAPVAYVCCHTCWPGWPGGCGEG